MTGNLREADVCMQVDILFIHAPDARIPFEETLSGIDALHKQGAFKRFGLSNHTAEQVEEVVNICNEKGFVAPSVFGKPTIYP